jgi:ribose/xylose/arabinose/galactoside ABC-type transport system permease subunit
MVVPTSARRFIPTLLLAVALALCLWVIRSQVDLAIGAAACLERANFFLISCVAPPPDWQLILSTALAVGLAILLGTRLRQNRA